MDLLLEDLSAQKIEANIVPIRGLFNHIVDVFYSELCNNSKTRNEQVPNQFVYNLLHCFAKISCEENKKNHFNHSKLIPETKSKLETSFLKLSPNRITLFKPDVFIYATKLKNKSKLIKGPTFSFSEKIQNTFSIIKLSPKKITDSLSNDDSNYKVGFLPFFSKLK
jgi:hypothetical protein